MVLLVTAASLLTLVPTRGIAGGGWVDEQGKGSIRIGYDWKPQVGALRRDIEGNLYNALFNTSHDYRFLYLSGDVGIVPRLEGSLVLTYLWAWEIVDSTSEEPSQIYHGASDMWVGLKYQLLDGAFPVAVGGTVRLPYLYEASSTRNGQPLTNVPGLLGHDYELSVAVSHSITPRLYATAMGAFRLREGASANQLIYGVDGGYTLPMLDDRVTVRACIDGVASVGEPRESTSFDRFPGYRTERDGHAFDFNNASYFRPQVGLNVRVLPGIDVGLGFAYIVWGHSTVVYRDILAQIGYTF